MKKNLRIVSAAAAALLAVAPIAATAMPVNAANVTNITLGGTSAPKVASDVTVSSNVSAVTKANAVLTDTTTGNTIARYNWDGKISGSISASWGGKTYSGNLTPNESTVSVWWYNQDTHEWKEVTKGSNGLYALEPGVKYYVEVPAVAFNFGTENANKKNIKLGAANGMKFISTSANNTRTWSDEATVDTDANGAMINPKGLEVAIPVTPVDTANADVVSFFERATGTNVNSGSIDVNAVNGSINVSSIMSAFNAKYSAHQLENGANAAANVTTTAKDVTDQLTKAGIKVDSLGNIADAPKAMNLTFKAKSPANGAEVSMPVVVNVPNGKETPAANEVTKNVTVMHIATIYDKNGKATTEPVLRAYNSVSVVSEPVTINGAKFYKIAGKDQYIKVGNIDGTKRTLKHNSYVYKSNGKAYTHKVGKKTKKVLKKSGSEVTTYGKSFMIHGSQMWRIGKNQYIKVRNF